MAGYETPKRRLPNPLLPRCDNCFYVWWSISIWRKTPLHKAIWKLHKFTNLLPHVITKPCRFMPNPGHYKIAVWLRLTTNPVQLLMGEMHKSQDLGWEEKWERDVNFGNFYFPLSMSVRSEVSKERRADGRGGRNYRRFLRGSGVGRDNSRSVHKERVGWTDELTHAGRNARLGWPSSTAKGWQKQECNRRPIAAIFTCYK